MAGEPMDTLDLTPAEQAWLKQVWVSAKIAKAGKPTELVIKPGRTKSKPVLLARFKVLLGESGAGNDNPDVLKELGDIAAQLSFRGWISDKDLAKVEQLIALS